MREINIQSKIKKLIANRSSLIAFFRASRENGVTLLELLVSISIFAATVSVVVAVFISMSASQKRSASSVDIDSATYFAMEAMAKEIRTGSDFVFPYSGFSDVTGMGGTICSWADINSSCQVLRFINYRGQIVVYRLNDAVGAIERLCVADANWDGDGDGAPDGGDGDGVIDAGEKDCFSTTTNHEFSRVTPTGTMRVTDLRFNLDGQNYGGNPDRKQSRVIITLKAETPAGTPTASKRDIILQTVISSRGPDS